MTDYLLRNVNDEIDELAPVFDELTVWSSRFGHLLLDHLEIRPRMIGLDLGCGTGFPLLELAALHGPSSHWTGIDPWRAGVEVVRRKIEAHHLRNVDVQVGDAAALPLADRSVDLITSNLGINNMADPSAVLREAARVARSGARLVITTNPTGTLPEVYSAMRDALATEAPDAIPALDAQEAHRGTLASISQEISEAGFEVTRVIPSAFEMRFADAAALLNHLLILCLIPGWRSAFPRDGHREIFARVEEALDRRAAAEGCVRTTIQCLYIESTRSE